MQSLFKKLFLLLVLTSVSTMVHAQTPIVVQSDLISPFSEKQEIKIVNFVKQLQEEGRYYDAEWLEANCTYGCLEMLKANYDYDGEGYAGWLLVGHEAGIESKMVIKSVTMVNRRDKRVARVVQHHDSDGYGHEVIRILYFSCVLENGQVKIDDVERGEDVVL